MTIDLKVIPGAKKNCVKEEQGLLKVYLTAPPLDGRANAALIKVLADHFHVKKRQVVIVRGLKSRNKTVTIERS